MKSHTKLACNFLLVTTLITGFVGLASTSKEFRKSDPFCSPIKTPFDSTYGDIIQAVQMVLSKGNTFSGGMNKYGYYSRCYRTKLLKKWRR